MIRFLHRKEIDDIKWNNLIAKHPSGLPYAYTWYLDIVCPEWKAFVFEDYMAIMPLPVERKLLLPYVYQPDYCQQLGVFADSDAAETVAAFYSALNKKFWFYHIQQNPQINSSLLPYSPKQKTNLILSLNLNYDNLYKGFSDNTKRNIGRAKKLDLVYNADEMSPRRFVEIYSNTTASVPKSKITTLIKALAEHKMLHLLSVKTEFMEVLAADVVIKTPKRLIHLIPATTANGKNQGAMHFLLDRLIHQYAETDTVLDFEGSSVASIARFYQSFGAKEEPFFDFRKRI